MKESTLQVLTRLLGVDCLRFDLNASAFSRMGLQDILTSRLSVKTVYEPHLLSPTLSKGSLALISINLSSNHYQLVNEAMLQTAVTYCDIDFILSPGKETDEILESLKS